DPGTACQPGRSLQRRALRSIPGGSIRQWTSRLLGLRGFVFDAASARAERVQKRCYRLQFVRAQPNGVRQAYGGYSGQTLFHLLEKLRGGSIEGRIKIPHVKLLTRQLSGVLAGVCEEQKLRSEE